ncbi:MAG: CDP-alcohol phosphatidyltransferase family protein [Candidatus Latescibacterota bacterium]|nr:CDP-alcohol phosphatidyltransferase family protein [Candidatus Latescibacterota bacterium]
MDQAILLFPSGPAGKALSSSRVAGLNLIDRQIRTLDRAGIKHVSIILPEGTELDLPSWTTKLDISKRVSRHGQDIELPNPRSSFLVIFAEYVHHHSSISTLLKNVETTNKVLVHASHQPPQQVPLRRVNDMFAEETNVDLVCASGLFLCPPSNQLANSFSRSEDPWQIIVNEPKGDVHKSEEALWCRVDTKGGARAAKRMLFSQVTKKTSGFISRNINARISIPTSKVLVDTGLSPHAITVLFVLTTGLGSAYLVSDPRSYTILLVSGILWQFAAIFDRCDGEVARVKLCESKFGAWFDTVTDNFAYLCGCVGTLIGMNTLHPDTSIYNTLGLSSIFAMTLTVIILYSYARKTGTGSLQNYLRALADDVDEKDKIWIQKLMEHYGFIAKRDFFSFYVFVVLAAGQLSLVYWFLVVVLHMTALAVIMSRGSMNRHIVKNDY